MRKYTQQRSALTLRSRKLRGRLERWERSWANEKEQQAKNSKRHLKAIKWALVSNLLGKIRQKFKYLILNGKLVGTAGFEPATTCTPCRCATRLRYAPRMKSIGIMLEIGRNHNPRSSINKPYRHKKSTDSLIGKSVPYSVLSKETLKSSRPLILLLTLQSFA